MKEKLLILILVSLLLISGISGHEGHEHEENESEGVSEDLISEYPSSAKILGIFEITLGLGILGLAGIHFFIKRDS